MPKSITRFRGAYAFLSNFYTAPVELDGILYPSVENAYQAAKTLDDRTFYLTCSPVEAKRRQDKLRPGWDEIKLRIMDDLLRQKFATDSLLARKLINTEDADIIHDNYWRDTFWGVYQGQGTNYLGRLLMRIRKDLVS